MMIWSYEDCIWRHSFGMLGCGVVGSSVARLLQEDSGDFAARSGAHLSLTKVAVKNLSTKRDHVSPALLTDDAASVVNDPSIDIVIEVMGGIEPARQLILSAIKNGKSIITANKALLALHGAELFEAADKNKVDLYYEAARRLVNIWTSSSLVGSCCWYFFQEVREVLALSVAITDRPISVRWRAESSNVMLCDLG